MPFARIPLLRALPDHHVRLLLRGGSNHPEVVAGGITWTGSGPESFSSSIRFTEVSDVLAEKLGRELYSCIGAESATNPKRFEIVVTRKEADAIEAAELKKLAGIAERGACVYEVRSLKAGG